MPTKRIDLNAVVEKYRKHHVQPVRGYWVNPIFGSNVVGFGVCAACLLGIEAIDVHQHLKAVFASRDRCVNATDLSQPYAEGLSDGWEGCRYSDPRNNFPSASKEEAVDYDLGHADGMAAYQAVQAAGLQIESAYE